MKKLLLLITIIAMCFTSMAQFRLSNKPPRKMRVNDSIQYTAKQWTPEEMATLKKKAQELHTQRQIKGIEDLYDQWRKGSFTEKRVIEVNIMMYYPGFDTQLLRYNKNLYVFMKTLYDEPLEW